MDKIAKNNLALERFNHHNFVKFAAGLNTTFYCISRYMILGCALEVLIIYQHVHIPRHTVKYDGTVCKIFEAELVIDNRLHDSIALDELVICDRK